MGNEFPKMFSGDSYHHMLMNRAALLSDGQEPSFWMQYAVRRLQVQVMLGVTEPPFFKRLAQPA